MRPTKKPPVNPSRIETAALALATQQLAALANAGIHLVRALEVVGRNSSSARLRSVFEQVTTSVHEGSRLSRSMQRFPGAFPRLYVAMIRVGEETGGLAEVLDRLQRWLARDLHLMRRLLASLVYPALALVTALALTLLLFGVVLPPTLDLLLSLSPTLPWFASALLVVSQAVRNPLFWALGLAALVNLGLLAQARWKDPVGRRQISAVAQSVPVLGSTLRAAALARYCAAMALMVEVGVALDQALVLGAEATANPLYIEDAARLVAALRDGEDLPPQLSVRPELYPPTMVQLLALGLETSTLGSSCRRMATWYDEELAYRLELLQALLEPLLMVFVSVVVATVLLGIVMSLQSVLGQLR